MFAKRGNMPNNREELRVKITNLLDRTPGRAVKEPATELGANRTYLAGYLQALEDMGYVKSRNIGPARVYLNNLRKEDK